MKVERVVGYIRELTERIRIEIQNIPRTIRPQNIPEAIEIVLKFLNLIIRIKTVIKLTEAAEKLDIAPRDKLQITYFKEILKEHMNSIYNSTIRTIQVLKEYFSQEAFERAIFDELEIIAKEIAKEHIPQEIIEEEKKEDKEKKEEKG